MSLSNFFWIILYCATPRIDGISNINGETHWPSGNVIKSSARPLIMLINGRLLPQEQVLSNGPQKISPPRFFKKKEKKKKKPLAIPPPSPPGGSFFSLFKKKGGGKFWGAFEQALF